MLKAELIPSFEFPRLLAVIVTNAFFLFSMRCDYSVICPPKSVYLSSGNDCVFFLKNCGNASYARQQCREKDATLVSKISNVAHFNGLCQFAQERLPRESSVYLDAYRKSDAKGGYFLWKLDNTEVSFFTNVTREENDNNCLELVVLDSGCDLKDAPCNKQTWPLCEFPHANPCVYEKGGCEFECIPRHRGDRKCVCQDGQAAINGKCPPAQISRCSRGYIYLNTIQHCVFISHKIRDALDICRIYAGARKFDRTRFQDGLSMQLYCEWLYNTSNSDEYYVADMFYKNLHKITWFQDRETSDSFLCPSDQGEFDCLAIFMNVDEMFECCVKTINCSTMARGLCTVSPRSVPKEIKVKPSYDCDVERGGCHHECRMTNGSRECWCWEGFELVNDTECRYKDKCIGNGGVEWCPEPDKLGVYPDTHCVDINNDTVNADQTGKGGGIGKSFFSIPVVVGGIVVTLVILMACSRLIGGLKNRRRQGTNQI